MGLEWVYEWVWMAWLVQASPAHAVRWGSFQTGRRHQGAGMHSTGCNLTLKAEAIKNGDDMAASVG